jgi:hypothetical protein
VRCVEMEIGLCGDWLVRRLACAEIKKKIKLSKFNSYFNYFVEENKHSPHISTFG